MIGPEISETIEERFQILEGKVLYQDRTIDDLNKVVIRQQDQIDRLTSELRQIRDHVTGEGEGIDAGKEPPPPHY